METTTTLPPDLQAALTRETHGEAVRWIGQPNPATTFWKATPIWFVGVPWLAFALTIIGMIFLSLLQDAASEQGITTKEYATDAAAFLFTGALAVFGMALLIAPFIARRRARRTVHAITSERLITLTLGRAQVTRSVRPQEVVRLERKEKKHGRGTLTVVTGIPAHSDGGRVEEKEELIGVPEVAAAERHLLNLMREPSR